MDRVRAGRQRHFDEAVGLQVALGGRRGTDEVRLVRREHVGRESIDLRVDGDRANAALTRGPHDANGDLTTVGDEQGPDHADAPSRLQSGKTRSTPGVEPRSLEPTAGVW
jgi:hypothetical protein